MTEIKVGPYHIRGHTSPTSWELFIYKKSKKTGRPYEKTLGWYAKLSQALSRASETHLATADAQSVAELLEAVDSLQVLMKEMDE